MRRILVVAWCMVFAGFTAAEAADIYMKSGRVIHSDTVYKENGMVYYSVAGQTVGVAASLVDRVDESGGDAVVYQRHITIRKPRYFEVSSTLAGVENGLYEEVFLGKACPSFRKVFGTGALDAAGCDGSAGFWTLGAKRPSSPDTLTLAVLRHVPKGKGPDLPGALWTSTDGRVCQVVITPGQAPSKLAEEPKLLKVLKFNGFPNAFFNGVYKPWAIVNGRIAYKMAKAKANAKDEATIELRASAGGKPSYHWAVLFGGDIYYNSASFETPSARLPHEVKRWTREGSVTVLPEVRGEVDTEREHTFEFQP